jgi:tetratricopeptide (TPR) repeat protein
MSIDADLSRAKSMARKGDVAEARRIYEAVLARFPANQRAQEGLRALAGPGGGAPSPAARSAPIEDHLEELSALYGRGRHGEVVDRGGALASAFPGSAPLANLVGAALAVLGRLPEAMDWYAKAIRLEPRYAEAHHNLANAQKALGRQQEALASYARALAARPGYAEAHRNLSAIKTYAAGDPQIAEMERLAANPRLADRDRMHLGYALAKAWEDTGRTTQAFAQLELAGRLRKKELGYDIAQDREHFATIRRVFGGEAASAGEVPAEPERLSKRPIFILGMPRSGTTLVEQILASHTHVHGAGEMGALNRLAGRALADIGRAPDAGAALRQSLPVVRAGYDKTLAGAGTEKPIVTDKMPSNFRWIGFIRHALPEAIIIHVRRNPVATCWSVYKTYFATSGNGFSYDLDDVAGYYRLYRELMDFWRERFPGAIYDLDYERLTEDQEAETRKLLAHCGLDWEDACLAFHETKRAVETASAGQVRRAMYKGSSDEWRKFERELSGLLQALPPVKFD